MKLQSFYAPPGRILVATDQRPLGCVALLPHETGIDELRIGELRRLFVAPEARTSGLGRRLAEHIIEYARAEAMHRIVLNTLPTMTNAIALYQTLGFTTIDPYTVEPTYGVLYFGLDLAI